MTPDSDMNDFSGDQPDMPGDAMDLTRIHTEVPAHLETLPDGREAVEFGDAGRCAEFNHLQGDNDLGFQGTCGLVSCEDVLRQFGVDVNEDDIVNYAADHHFCEVSERPSDSGGTTPFDQVKILEGHDVPAHVEACDSLENLAGRIEDGHGIIVGLNAGVLWDNVDYYDNGQANHAIVVTGLDRDPQTGEILGFKINDSGVPPSGNSNHFVDAEKMSLAWLGSESGGCGLLVSTDVVLSPNNQPSTTLMS